MVSKLATIRQELRRLQREGAARVFIDDATLDLLPQQQKAAAKVAAQKNLHGAEARPAVAPSQLPGDNRRPTSDASTAKPRHAPVDEDHGSDSALLEKPAEIVLSAGDAATQLAELKKQVMACPTCNAQLEVGGKIVFGSGSPSADIFFCGEAPGADEELAGTPFVGKAGQLLDKIISAMGMEREQVYLANILKWRPRHDKPYGNRPPTAGEMRFCLPYLEAQIAIVQPKVVVALGNTAVTGLLGADPRRKMSDVRGTWGQFNQIPLLITFHPSYLLRNGTLKTKRLVWEDMLALMERCNLPVSERQRQFFLPR